MAPLDGQVVLVGHSLGGLTIPVVAARHKVDRLVFLCAGYPEPGRSHMDVRTSQPGETVASGPSAAWQQPGDAHRYPDALARELFFHDCPPEVQDWAVARLRPQARKPLREVTPLVAWPDTPRTLIITTEDRCIPRDSAVRTAERLFGTRPIELPGGHCPAISRPAHLARTLVDAIA
jgi:pimeloyl-ACP methyl ester carboxylesterase